MQFSDLKSERWVCQVGTQPKLQHIKELELLGYDRFMKAAPLTSHVHEHAYEFVYIEQGAVNWEVDGVTYHSHAQQMFHTKPGERHRASFNYIGPCTIWWMIIQDPEQDKEWFSLDEEERQQFIQLLKQQPRILSTNRAIVEPFRRLRRLIEQPETVLLTYQVRHYVLDVFLQLMQSSQLSHRSQDIHQFSVRLMERIEANPALRLSTEQMASEVGLSESHFYRVFRETNGQSPASYMDRVRMDYACRLLQQSSVSITNVAMDFGFKTSQHFATVFKKYIGLTPRAWRNQDKG